MARKMTHLLASLATIIGSMSVAHCEEAAHSSALPAVVSPIEFDKTYRLEFKLVTSETSESYIVLTSQSVFAIRYDVHKAGEEYGIDLAGNVAVVKEGERLRVNFKMSIDRASQEGDGFNLSSTGSAIVPLGKSKTVTKHGEYDLQLIATVEKDEDEPQGK